MSFRLAAYAVCITDGRVLLACHSPRDGEPTAESVWTPIPDVTGLRRSSLVDIGLTLARTLPSTGHVPPIEVGGLIQH
ncbi:hypothetical protein [Nocardia carnea]|uniref:NUDIX hydrolase n=1 Tax=Nocardia carnea TaxID=37328 RepID=A0ABW7TV97_9NOCA|nr:hypothetical protein [Nocardia carnea]